MNLKRKNTGKVTMGPQGTQKIIVVSHERSGTHFLMNTLDDNFGYISYPWIDFDTEYIDNPYASENILEFIDIVRGKPILELFKCHYEVNFFWQILEQLFSEFRVFYIYRDGHDTMESFCKHLNGFDWRVGPKVSDGMALAVTEPSGALMRYQMWQYKTMWDRHFCHVAQWRNLRYSRFKDQIFYIRYEDLRDNFDNTVLRIGAWLDMEMINDEPVKPGKRDRVIATDKEMRNEEPDMFGHVWSEVFNIGPGEFERKCLDCGVSDLDALRRDTLCKDKEMRNDTKNLTQSESMG